MLFFPIIFISAAVAAQYFSPAALARFRNWAAVAGVFGVCIEVSVRALLLYASWLRDPVMRLALPPHRDIGYFASHAFARLFASPLIALFIALLAALAIALLNRLSGERFFEREEYAYAFLAIFLVGYPGLAVYIPLLLVAHLARAAFDLIVSGALRRVSFRFLWLTLALPAILISSLLANFPPFRQFAL